MDIEFRDGFVYSDIPMEKKIFGYFVPSPEEIKNRRINIPEFFQRISDEASVYRSQPSSSGE
ncbi:MAG TPA: hypothetical protein PLY93_06840 [Turneriella sp.]|nr:hypothetical protein [Turneriella sp.]